MTSSTMYYFTKVMKGMTFWKRLNDIEQNLITVSVYLIHPRLYRLSDNMFFRRKYMLLAGFRTKCSPLMHVVFFFVDLFVETTMENRNTFKDITTMSEFFMVYR